MPIGTPPAFGGRSVNKNMSKILKVIISIIIIIVVIAIAFFVFNKKEELPVVDLSPIVIEEQNEQYDISVRVERTGIKSIDIELDSFVQNRIEELKTITREIKADSDYEFIAGLGIKSQSFISGNLKSLMLEIYDYAGGVHGNVYYKTWTFDENGNILTLHNLFQDNTDFLSVIFPIVKEQLITQLQSPVDENQLINGTGDQDEQNYSNFVLDNEKIIFFFSPYQVAAYAEGPKKAEVMLDDLREILSLIIQP